MEEIKRRMVDPNADPDDDAVYQRLMERSALRTDGSGLGLGRVRAEALMILSVEELEGEVCITAEATNSAT